MTEGQNSRVLLKGEFSSMASSWTDHPCLVRDGDTIRLMSFGHEELGEVSRYAVEDEHGDVEHHLPSSIDGKQVVGIKAGEYIIGGDLVPQDDGAEIALESDKVDEARGWLEAREWHLKPGFDRAWREICRVSGGRK